MDASAIATAAIQRELEIGRILQNNATSNNETYSRIQLLYAQRYYARKSNVEIVWQAITDKLG